MVVSEGTIQDKPYCESGSMVNWRFNSFNCVSSTVEGASIIIISHRLEDIFKVADRVIILRHGRNVGEKIVEGDIHAFREDIVAYMIGARDDAVSPEETALA